MTKNSMSSQKDHRIHQHQSLRSGATAHDSLMLHSTFHELYRMLSRVNNIFFPVSSSSILLRHNDHDIIHRPATRLSRTQSRCTSRIFRPLLHMRNSGRNLARCNAEMRAAPELPVSCSLKTILFFKFEVPHHILVHFPAGSHRKHVSIAISNVFLRERLRASRNRGAG